jgi:CheY-like chemotaxis protein
MEAMRLRLDKLEQAACAVADGDGRRLRAELTRFRSLLADGTEAIERVAAVAHELAHVVVGSEPVYERGKNGDGHAARGASESHARVLVIDDDPKLLLAFECALEARFDVVTACGGAAGIALLERDTRFDAVICDLMMPGLDGPTVYEKVRAIAPALADRFVFTSGGAYTARARRFLKRLHAQVLLKPVEAPQLTAAIDAARESHIG